MQDATLMKDMTLMHSKRERMMVKFNAKDQVIDRNGAKYNSYIGMLAHTKVPINVVEWKLDLKETKENIWQEILVYITYL